MLGASLASAQGWEVGAKAGVSHNVLSGSQEFVWNGAVPTTSAFARGGLTRRLSIQPELGLQRRVGISTLVGSTLTLTADYLELPLMLQLHRSTPSALQPYVTAGPSLTYRLRCSLLFKGGGLVSDNDCDAFAGAKSNRLDLGAAAGIGLNLHFGVTTVQIEGRAASGVRSNVLPIDVQARSIGWSAVAGVSTAVGGRPRPIPGARPRSVALGPLSDANIAAMILAYSTTDVSYAQLVPRRSDRGDVRDFARQMQIDHSRVIRQVYDVLRTLDIGAVDNDVSRNMRDESSQQREPMYFIAGRLFDSSYVEAEARVQREFLAILDEVTQRAESHEMRALLVNLRPAVAAHLANAERVRGLVAGPVVASAPRRAP